MTTRVPDSMLGGYLRADSGVDGNRLMAANPDQGGPDRDATTYLQGLLNAASAAYDAAQGRVKLRIPPGVWMVDALQPTPNVIVDWTGVTIKKRRAPDSVLTNSLVRGVRAEVAGTYYGAYDHIRWIGGTWDPNGFACPANILLFEEFRSSELIDITVQHRPGLQHWAFQISGRDVRIVNPRVLGGTEVFQDGLHLTHGRLISVQGGYIECGDDAIALGYDIVSANQDYDDEALELVSVNGTVVNSASGYAVKVYYGIDTPGIGGTHRRRVRNVTVRGVTGYTGQIRNGGVSMLVPTADNATDPTVMQNIDIEVNLQVGAGATHDGVNPYGVHVQTGDHVKIDARLVITDTTGAAARFRPLLIEGGRDVEVKLTTTGPVGRAALISPKHSTTVAEELRISGGDFHAGSVDGISGLDILNAAGAAMGPIRVLGNTIRGIRNTSYGVLTGASGTVSVLDIQANTFRKLTGATTARAYAAGGASFVGHLNMVGNDMSDVIGSLGSFNTNHASYFVRDNRGFKSKAGGTATITAAATTVSVSHGLDVRLAAATSAAIPQITVVPTNAPTNAIKWSVSVAADTAFAINCDTAPGASTATFAWSVDTSQKPVA
jgi:hypothetical protein